MKAGNKSLIDLGGVANRIEIKLDIYDNSTLVPEYYIDFTRTSKQTGLEYKLFNYSLTLPLSIFFQIMYVIPEEKK